MGQAKQRQKREREDMLRVLEKWSYPPSEWEAAMVSEVEQLPVTIVQREPPERLAWARMKPRLCHDNCAWYERNDPTGKSKACTGWIRDEFGNYVLHTVVNVGDEYVCITPMPNVSGTHLEFIPDPAITVSIKDDKFYHYRKGQRIGAGLRSEPEKTLAQVERVKERIASGMDAMEAARTG